ncbi:hypothetical protein A2U01_0078759, partial [Trifolium medium]|nr:hypothetical protein [Trifolium medium]
MLHLVCWVVGGGYVSCRILVGRRDEVVLLTSLVFALSTP